MKDDLFLIHVANANRQMLESCFNISEMDCMDTFEVFFDCMQTLIENEPEMVIHFDAIREKFNMDSHTTMVQHGGMDI